MHSAKKHILVIEDEKDQLELIEYVFEQEAKWADLSVAHSLAEAQTQINAATPDLVISDLRLPDGDGMSLLNTQRNGTFRPVLGLPHALPKTFPVVIMSGYGDQQAAVEAMKAGALDYIVKDSKMLMNLPRVAERVLREWDLIRKREQAEEALRINLAKTELLYDTARAISAVEILPKKLQTIVDNTAEALPASLVSLSTIDLANRNVSQTVVGGWHVDAFVPPTFEELWDGLAGWSLRTLEPLLAPANTEREHEGPAARQRREQLNIGSMIFAPLTYRGRTLGILTAMNRVGERDFTERHMDLVVALANQAAGAVENSRLFEETNRLLNQMRKRANQIQQIIDTVPDGVLLLDGRRRIVQENMAAREYLDLIPGRRVGQILTHLGGTPIIKLLTLPAGQDQHTITLTTDLQQEFEIFMRRTRAGTKPLFIDDASDSSEWVMVIHNMTQTPAQSQKEQRQSLQGTSRLARMARSLWS